MKKKNFKVLSDEKTLLTLTETVGLTSAATFNIVLNLKDNLNAGTYNTL